MQGLCAVLLSEVIVARIFMLFSPTCDLKKKIHCVFLHIISAFSSLILLFLIPGDFCFIIDTLIYHLYCTLQIPGSANERSQENEARCVQEE